MRKAWIPALVVAALGAAAVWVVYAWTYGLWQAEVTAMRQSHRAAWDQWKTEVGEPTKPAAAAPAASPQVVTQVVHVTATNALDPAEIIRRLASQRVGTGVARIRQLREVVFYLESLARLKDGAVPAIRAYLLRFEDVAYLTEAMLAGGGSGGGTGPGETDPRGSDFALGGDGTPVRINFEFPPTLRLGLIDTLRSIGTSQAMSVLLENLQATSRGVEVAGITRALEELAPGRYRSTALATAHELLRNLPQVDGSVELDRRQKDYLYAVLAMFGDGSFADGASQTLVGADGQLDRHAFDYLTKTLAENSMPLVYQAWADERMTNFVDRSSLLAAALPFAGTDSYANAMFAQVVTNPALPGPLRSATIAELVSNWQGRDLADDNAVLDPALAATRLQLLQNITVGLDDELIARAIDRVTRRLTEAVTGVRQPPPARPRFRSDGK